MGDDRRAQRAAASEARKNVNATAVVGKLPNSRTTTTATRAYDVVETGGGNSQRSGELIDAHAQWFQNVLAWRLSSMERRYQIISHKVIHKSVDVLVIIGCSVGPSGHPSVLPIRCPESCQVAKRFGLIQPDEPAKRCSFDQPEFLRGLLPFFIGAGESPRILLCAWRAPRDFGRVLAGPATRIRLADRAAIAPARN